MSTSAAAPLIALISATPTATPPIADALAQHFPAARPWNIIDDRLLTDATERGGVTPSLAERMNRLIRHAVTEGADGILLTCSIYGAVAHDFPSPPVPLLAADDASFALAAEGGYAGLLVVASLPTAARDSEKRLRRALEAAGATTHVTSIVAEGAAAAAAAADTEALARTLHEACLDHLKGIDAIFLAQYSLAPAAERLAQVLGLPVITGPDAAAIALRTRLGPDEAAP